MMRRLLILAVCLCAPAIKADDTTFNTPVKKFRLPTFNDAGFRTSMLVGDQATVVTANQVDITEMHLTVFAGDEVNAVSATLLAPVATIRIQEHGRIVVEGKKSVRLIRDDLDASGEEWSYAHPDKKLTMSKNVHVLFHAELKDLLK